jgi:predicted acylesterase/phospholipase RssA
MSMMHAQMVKSYLLDAQIIIEPKIGDFGFFDFSKGKEIIESGRKAAIEKIPEIKRKLRIR